ncbi:MAG: alpha/beta fold hydrolase [Hyphomicrobiaceae bacterium]
MPSTTEIQARGRKVAVIESGNGPPLLYLHGFADLHGLAGEPMAFHQGLAERRRMIAPAHPGCNGSDDLSDGNRVEDYLFHVCEVLDSLGLDRCDVVGHCVGGWLAAELAVRHPERVNRLVLIGAAGLFVPGEPIADIFMHSQANRGTSFATLRRILFASESHPQALRHYPDGRGEVEEEMRRYAMLRFASAIGFRPPYLYNRPLVDRLYRADMPSLVVWGGSDGMVPPAHGKVYAERLGGASQLCIVENAGHAVHVERASEVLAAVTAFLD